MTRVHVFCEGQTEESFVRELLIPHFQRRGVWINPIVVRTSASARGGVTTYGRLRSQVLRKCQEDRHSWVTTLLDFYGLPADFPGMPGSATVSSLDRASVLQEAFQSDIGMGNFIAHLVVHEFEGLLFSHPEAFANFLDEPGLVEYAKAVRDEFESPEHINDGRNTAPSRRIQRFCSAYDKVLHGTLIALDIGLDRIRRECHRFDGWLSRLEAMTTGRAP